MIKLWKKSLLMLWEFLKSVRSGGFVGMAEYEIFPFIFLRSNIFSYMFQKASKLKRVNMEQPWGREPRRVSIVRSFWEDVFRKWGKNKTRKRNGKIEQIWHCIYVLLNCCTLFLPPKGIIGCDWVRPSALIRHLSPWKLRLIPNVYGKAWDI